MTERPEDRWPDFLPPEDSPSWQPLGGEVPKELPQHPSEQTGTGPASGASGPQGQQAANSHPSSQGQWQPPSSQPTAQRHPTGRRTDPERWFNQPAASYRIGVTQPAVTITLIVSCVVVWLLQRLSYTINFAVTLFPDLAWIQPWRLITSAFAHDPRTFTHILFNMLMLFILGRQLEAMLGKAKYLTIYLLSALGGSVFFVLLAPSTVGAVGASGAIFGLFGAYFVTAALNKQPILPYAVLLGANVVMALIPGVAWQAHLGGLVIGAATMYTLTKTRPAWPGALAILAGLIAVLVVKYTVIGL